MQIHEFSASILAVLQQIIIHGGYTIVFIVAAIESLPLLGTLIPGQTVVMLSGFVAKLGYINPFIVTAFAVVGAFCGDIFSYALGRRFGYNLLVKYGRYFLITPLDIEKAQIVVDRHTGKSLLIGRFNPLTRPLVPFAVGASRVRLKRFLPINALGCLIWASLSVAAGYVFGASYELVSEILGKIVLIGFIVIGLLIWGYRYINSRRHIFTHYELHILALNVVAIYVFTRTMQDALSAHTFLVQFDVWLSIFIEQLSHSWNTFFVLVSYILSPAVLSIVGGVYIIHLAIKRKFFHATILAVTTGVGLFLTSALKEIVGRVRPDNAVMYLVDQSFPSGHTVAATIFFFFVAYLFAKQIKNSLYREFFVVTNFMMVVLVGFSRIYLNVHWFTDVVAGAALGLIVSTTAVLVMRYVVASHIRRLLDTKE